MPSANPKIAPYAVTNLSEAQPLGGGPKGGSIIIEVNGVELKAAQLSLSYGFNAIPAASAMIPLGRDARTGKVSEVNNPEVIKGLKQMAPVVIKMKGTLKDWSTVGGSVPGSKKQWPSGEHTLFVGYISGIAYRRTLGRVSLVINAVHKLVDLTMSSTGSANLVPGAPQDMLLPTLIKSSGGQNYALPGSRFVEQLSTDMDQDYSEGLLKVFEELCQDDQIQIHDETWCGADSPNKRDNSAALNVLKGDGDWKGVANLSKQGDMAQYTEAYPLAIHSAGKNYVSNWVGQRVSDSLAGNSIWAALVGSILPSFGMGIIPAATEAYIAPILPMNRTPEKTINTNEYVDFNMSMMSQRPLFGVGILSTHNLATVEKRREDTKVCVGASYTAPVVNGKPNEGMWMFAPAPGWLDGWVNYDPDAVDGNSGVNNLMNEPSHDAAGVDENAVDRSPSEEATEWSDELSKYARMVYAANALRNREGSLVGKLRFDIAPGTTIKINAKNAGGDDSDTDNLAVALIGFVASVSVTINAEQGSATTTFAMTNLRTEDENNEDRFSMEDHPFFNSKFKYAPLVTTLKVD